MQSPQWDSVEHILSNISIDMSYYARGINKATYNLNTLLTKHRGWVNPLIDLKDFKHGYLTAGATEAINLWRLSDNRPWQYLEGDYQWPQIVSKNGTESQWDNLDPNKVLYISNPSCIDGNYITNEHIDLINDIGCPVIYDCAYVTASRRHTIRIPDNTEQVFFSFSKGFGIIGQRCGLMYTKKRHSILSPLANVECYNYTSIQIMDALMKAFAVDRMYDMYFPTQLAFCKKHDVVLSDTYFIVTSGDPFYAQRRRHGETARLCITPQEIKWETDTHYHQ